MTLMRMRRMRHESLRDEELEKIMLHQLIILQIKK